ncbi:MAG: PilW family protein [Pseudomonadota bacterium]
MKNKLNRAGKGFTIIELMVSLTIGLIVTWAVTSLFTVTTKTFRSQDSSARTQETGRNVLSIFAQHIRQAGFFELTGLEKATNFTQFVAGYTGFENVLAIKGCKGTFAYASPWNCTTNTALPDSMLLAYQVQSTTAASTAGINNLLSPLANSIVGTDCLGQDPTATSASPKGIIAINYFHVDTTTRRLMCRGNGSSSDLVLADGVEDLRVLYGLNANSLVASSPIQYLPANLVPAADWPKIQSVRICVQVRATQVSTGSSKSSGVEFSGISGQDCQGRDWSQTGLYTDGILRRAYWTTISVRNQNQRIPL